MMIGLLTPYKVNNYGTKLQAYAVQALCRNYGDTAIVLYTPNLFDKAIIKVRALAIDYKRFNDSKNIESSKKVVNPQNIEIRNKAIKSFDDKLIFTDEIIGYNNLRRFAKGCDAFVCGSDQIWNPINLLMKIYMLEFVPNEVRRISIAPSFGVTNLNDTLKRTYKKRIKHIEFLSVREESGCKIIESLGRNDCFWMLDPTLLVDKNEWERLSSESKVEIDKKYIFCYFLGSHSDGREFARKVKQATGYNIVNLPHFKSYNEADEEFADINLYDVTPQDFINLIRNAEIVCTDSFHGTAFSIIFNKTFFCFSRHKVLDEANTNSRITSLFQKLCIPQIYYAPTDFNLGMIKIDYSKIDMLLYEERKKCREFLDDSFLGKR